MNCASRYEFLRNDIYHIWLQQPELTSHETLETLRAGEVLERPQKGLIEYISLIRKDFDGIVFVEDPFMDLKEDDTPPGANPFMKIQ